MAVNRSSNKVRVSRLFGADAGRGLMGPQVNMRVKHQAQDRWIVGLDSGDYHVSLALSSGGTVIAQAYAHELVIDEPTASGFGWPTGSDCVLFGHSGVFPQGVPLAIGSGMVYESGGGTEVTFSRPPSTGL